MAKTLVYRIAQGGGQAHDKDNRETHACGSIHLFGHDLPLITTNCAVLGVVLLNVQEGYNFIESVVYGITGGAGFLLYPSFWTRP